MANGSSDDQFSRRATCMYKYASIHNKLFFFRDRRLLVSSTMKSENGRIKPHAVVVPYPAQGHVTPCLQLARKLVAVHGFRITFVNTTHVHHKFMKLHASTAATEPDHEGIEFVAVSDGLPDDHPRVRDLTAFLNATVKMGSVFKELFINVLKKSAITCIIVDIAFTTLVHRIAKDLDIPVAFFVTSSAISAHCGYNLNTFISAGILPLPEASAPPINPASGTLALPQSDAEAAVRNALLTCLPGGSPTMRVDDIPTFMLSHDLDSFFIRFYLDHLNPHLPDSVCVLCNSFTDLEGVALNAMGGSMNENVLAVGPLVLDGVEEVTVAGVRSGLVEEDPVALTWLDDQKPSSVLFVSFGSIVTVSVDQMREFAAGLEASNVPFLWVVRSDLIADLSVNEEFETMFTGFVERTRDRALLVPWAPQTAVLSHPAVRAFLTHCGWNSVLESISCGVPMLGWPRFSDQNTNCHYITSVWKIGLELRQSHCTEDGAPIARKEEVAEKVRKIMDDGDEDVAEIRKRCRSLQMAARKAWWSWRFFSSCFEQVFRTHE